MGILRAIIQPPALPMGNAGHHASPRCRVARQLIGDDGTWTVTQPLEQLAEEPLRSAFVALWLSQDIENFTTLIHRPPETHKLPVYFAEDFIKMPGVATRTASSVQPSRVLGTKLECPQSNRLVRDFYAPGQYELGRGTRLACARNFSRNRTKPWKLLVKLLPPFTRPMQRRHSADPRRPWPWPRN
jgi:hypothetical protein